MAGIKYCPECIPTKMRRKSEKRIRASNPGYTLVIWQCPDCGRIVEERNEKTQKREHKNPHHVIVQKCLERGREDGERG